MQYLLGSGAADNQLHKAFTLSRTERTLFINMASDCDRHDIVHFCPADWTDWTVDKSSLYSSGED